MKAATRSNKTRTNKTDYMSDDAFADIKEAIEDALAFERGERRNLHVTRIQAPGPPNRLGHSVEVRISAKERSPEKTHTRVMIG